MYLHLLMMSILFMEQILEYHPQMLKEYLQGGGQTSFMYPR